ncbi:hypothetical protein ADUPG1_010824 [Aduncisulcus paluster]|uniref:Annexin n=1 Tax=Aduncisulcus paluster TaxID=2918883 RepID=A0ABQ5JU26_9EUKA|nr:hypothetical protein ADUPG1_010824 [Aduncisulcus paluster]
MQHSVHQIKASAKKLHTALEKADSDEREIIDILTRLPNRTIVKIQEEYFETYGSNLKDALMGASFGRFQAVLRDMCCDKLSYEAQQCRMAMTGAQVDIISLIEVICSVPQPHLRLIQKRYEELFFNPLQNDLKATVGGEVGKLLYGFLTVDRPIMTPMFRESGMKFGKSGSSSHHVPSSTFVATSSSMPTPYTDDIDAVCWLEGMEEEVDRELKKNTFTAMSAARSRQEKGSETSNEDVFINEKGIDVWANGVDASPDAVTCMHDLRLIKKWGEGDEGLARKDGADGHDKSSIEAREKPKEKEGITIDPTTGTVTGGSHEVSDLEKERLIAEKRGIDEHSPIISLFIRRSRAQLVALFAELSAKYRNIYALLNSGYTGECLVALETFVDSCFSTSRACARSLWRSWKGEGDACKRVRRIIVRRYDIDQERMNEEFKKIDLEMRESTFSTKTAVEASILTDRMKKKNMPFVGMERSISRFIRSDFSGLHERVLRGLIGDGLTEEE